MDWFERVKVTVGAFLLLAGLLGASVDGDFEMLGTAAFGCVLLAWGLAWHVPGVMGTRPEGDEYSVDIHGSRISARTGWAATVVASAALWAGAMVGGVPALSGVGVFALIMGWLVFFAGGLHRIEVDKRGLRWRTGAIRRRVRWEELASVQPTLDGLQLPSGHTLPLGTFAVEPDGLARALRAFAADQRLRERFDSGRFLRYLQAK